MQDSYEASRERGWRDPQSRFYRFAGKLARIDVDDAELAGAVLSAFAHLAATPGDGEAPALVVGLWSDSPANVGALRFGDYCVSADAQIVGHRSADWVAMYHRAQRRMVAFVPQPLRLSFLSRARPLKELLLVWYADNGFQPIHASMIATSAGDGVLLSGHAGAGKSTTAVVCMAQGFHFIGDDCVALVSRSDDIIGASIYSSCLVRPEMLGSLHPDLGGATDDPKGRVLVCAPEAFPGQTRTEAPIRAVLLPCVVAASRTVVTRVSKKEALRSLFPAALTVDPCGASRIEGFVALTDLLEKMPCYRVELGRDSSEIPDAIRRVLSD